MKFLLRRVVLGFFFVWLVSLSFASAYNARPKLIVIIVIDQFRGDYLERYRDQFGEGGFRLFLDHGANFTDCNYNYANTRTAPGHATLLSGAYWIDSKTGVWITSTYYRSDLPKWVQDFNDSKRAEKYLSQQWKDGNGNALRKTTPRPGKEAGFYELVGSTPFANDYEFEFARELINREKLGAGP